MASYLSRPNNTRYSVQSQSLINPYKAMNIISKGFAPIKVLYKTWIKIFFYVLLSNKILSKSKSSILVKSSK